MGKNMMGISKIIGSSNFSTGQLRDLIAARAYFGRRGVSIDDVENHIRAIDNRPKPPPPPSVPCECGGDLVLSPASDHDGDIHGVWGCKKCRLSIYDSRPYQTIIEKESEK
jgi:hypothetical protein